MNAKEVVLDIPSKKEIQAAAEKLPFKAPWIYSGSRRLSAAGWIHRFHHHQGRATFRVEVRMECAA